MRWFKHMTSSADDEKIAHLIDQCGLLGYGFFWRVMELIAAQVDDSNKNYCSYGKRVWCNKLAINHQTWSKLIASCEQAGLFEVSGDDQAITVKSPNILKYRDEWTRKKCRNSGVTPEQRRSKDTDTDTEKEEDNINPPLPPSPGGECEKSGGEKAGDKKSGDEKAAAGKPEFPDDFSAWWEAYPKKVAKRAAVRIWERKLKAKTLPELGVLLEKLREQEDSEQWQKSNGEFIPHPSTYLNQHRWEDETYLPGLVPDPFEGAI